jgi:hypothetical protein
VTTLSGAFLFYKDYQSQLTILNQKLTDTAMQVKNIQELQIKNIQEFQNKLKQDMEDIKNYNVHLGFVLMFPERIDEKNINILKKTPGETSWALTSATPSSLDTSKKTFTASLDLNRGDRVKIIGVGSDQQLKWTSGEIEVPNVVVEMRKSE